ncbi:ABC transporter substrate-binding protein [Pleionea sp. CnH1-48]|uniref:substrate-binding periplasmic protein n=1 Tax=Pleionea sp. CnH1-48 TaxID=2954494 RepID=UPI002096FA3F|nr:transporter substrate-binding domain-containing protein [Pleionea sp. CnH1-48]MCO7222790.1 transporter substrate-binding domain-containing protein [Pleionea sp. CnH1-48]
MKVLGLFFIGMLWMLTAQAKGQKIKVGVEDIDYFPYYASEDGSVKGFYKSLMEAFEKQSGYSFEFSFYPPTDVVQALIDNKVDVIFPDNEYWAKDKKLNAGIRYSQPVTDYIDGVFVMYANRALPLEKLSTLGIIKGFNPYPYYTRIDDGHIQLKVYENLEQLILALFNKEIQGAYFNKVLIEHFLSNFSLESLIQVPLNQKIIFRSDFPMIQSNYKASTIKQQEFLKSFNEFLSKKEPLETLKRQYNIQLKLP